MYKRQVIFRPAVVIETLQEVSEVTRFRALLEYTAKCTLKQYGEVEILIGKVNVQAAREGGSLGLVIPHTVVAINHFVTIYIPENNISGTGACPVRIGFHVSFVFEDADGLIIKLSLIHI